MSRQRSILDFHFTKKKDAHVYQRNDNMITKKNEDVKSEIQVKFESEEFVHSELDIICPICSINMSGIDITDRITHANQCIDTPNIIIPGKRESGDVSAASKRMRVTKSTEVKIETDNTKNDGKPRKKRTAKPKPDIPLVKILRFPDSNEIIAVDAFCYAPRDDISVYLLTHFHSDHYGGLCKSWNNGSLIICTPITARLVQHKFKFPIEKMFVVPEYGKEYTIPKLKDIKVSVFDANHCPGAGIFVLKTKSFKYLHCGDFRANMKMVEELKNIYPSGFDRCYLDTTYFNPKYSFPDQSDVIRYTSDWIKSKCKSHKSQQQRIVDFFRKKDIHEVKEFLVVIGTYSIGKERVALGIAKGLNTKVYCSKEKYAMMKLFEWNELEDILECDENKAVECGVHLLPMQKLRKDLMKEYLKKYSSAYRSILVVQPTGWTYGYTVSPDSDPHTEEATYKRYDTGFNNVKRDEIRDGVVPYRRIPVAYSEHSSYAELVMFIRTLPVKKWIPTVNMQTVCSEDLHQVLEATDDAESCT